MSAPGTRRPFDWEAAGHALGESLGGYHALVVIGVDPVATGRVAVGLARAQALSRRVAVGDLFAESPPIQELVHSDDPHGLVDSFLYGVSLTKIAHEVPGAGQLFVMPSGTEPPDYDEMLPNPRWHRLTAGFREVGALLVLAAPASAPHIEALVAAADGAILVGDGVPSRLLVTSVISSVRETRPVAPDAPTEVKAPVPSRKPRWNPRRIAAIGGVVLTLGLATVAAWLAYPNLAGLPARAARRPDTTGQRAIPTPVRPDSASSAGALDSAAVTAITPPRIFNPGDSLQAVAFAVELMAANTQAGAILKLQQDGKNLPAATFSPVLVQGARWYKVIAGAYATRADADSLLAGLRRRKLLDAGSGTVVRLPFAFLIDSALPAAAVPGVIASYADRGQPAYALRQADGTAWLLVGAFESVDQSGLYAESLQSLRASGVNPVLVYRKGRSF